MRNAHFNIYVLAITILYNMGKGITFNMLGILELFNSNTIRNCLDILFLSDFGWKRGN